MKHTPEELLRLSRAEKMPVSVRDSWYYLISLSAKTAHRLPTCLKLAEPVSARYLESGLDCLEARKAKGRTPLLSAKQKQLGDYIEVQSQSEQGGRLTGEKILNYIKAEFDVHYITPMLTINCCSNSVFRWIISCSRHPKQQQDVQEAYMQLPTGNDP